MCSPVKEKPGLIAGTKERPADVFLPQFSKGKDYLLDFAVTNPLSNYMIQQSIKSSKDACELYSDIKMNRYNKFIKDSVNTSFQPMIVDTFGKWETTAKSVIYTVAARLASRNNTDVASTLRHFHQKLSVILQKSNVRSVLCRIPVVDTQRPLSPPSRAKCPVPPKSNISTPASQPLPDTPCSQSAQWSVPPTPKTSSPGIPSIKSPANKNNPPNPNSSSVKSLNKVIDPPTPTSKSTICSSTTLVVPVGFVDKVAPIFPEICTSVNTVNGSDSNAVDKVYVKSTATNSSICVDLPQTIAVYSGISPIVQLVSVPNDSVSFQTVFNSVDPVLDCYKKRNDPFNWSASSHPLYSDGTGSKETLIL